MRLGVLLLVRIRGWKFRIRYRCRIWLRRALFGALVCRFFFRFGLLSYSGVVRLR